MLWSDGNALRLTILASAVSRSSLSTNLSGTEVGILQRHSSGAVRAGRDSWIV